MGKPKTDLKKQIYGVSGVLNGEPVDFTHEEVSKLAIASGLKEFFDSLAYELRNVVVRPRK